MNSAGKLFSVALVTSLIGFGCGGDDVDLDGPFISVQTSATSGVAPLTVSFVTDIVGDDDHRINFDFGDGTSTTFPSPTHTYTAPGIYTVDATVTDDDGNTDSIIIEIEVIADIPPNASASSDVTSGQEALSVAFDCEASEGNGELEVRWDLGDGQRSDLVNPTHVYEKAGDYVATCIVTDEQGDFDTDSITITVTPDTTPLVQISSTSRAGVAPHQVDFAAVVIGGEAPLTFSWDFGDGTAPSTNLTPSHTYTTAGQFAVVLTVTDSDGDEGTATVDIAVATDSIPGISVSAEPRTGIEPLIVQLSADVAGGNPPLVFAWDFDDGGTSAAQNPEHTFAAGTFNVALTVTDVDGDVAVDNVLVVVDADLPATVTAAATPTAGLTPLSVAFDATGGGNGPLTYLWDFGDGTTSTLEDPSHVYAIAGTFDATVTVTDANGDVAQDQVTIDVTEDTTPEVEIAANPFAGVGPLDVEFDAIVVGGEGALTFAWEFGDGNTSTLAAPTNTYAPGSYTVVVTVTDADGDVGFATTQIAVATNSVPAVAINASPTSGVDPLDVQFTSSVAGGNGPLTFAWDFDDGGTSAAANPSHTFGPGTFLVELTVTDADGDSDTAQITIDVAVDLPVTANAAVNPTSGIAPVVAQFDASTLGGDVGNPPLTYLWEFGDGGTSTLEDPSHTYTVPGSYVVSVTITDSDGDSDTDTDAILVIEDTGPQVVIDPRIGAASLQIDFQITTVGGNGNISQLIDFGDGSPVQASVNQTTISHVYPAPGNYNVVLTSTDLDGDSSIATTVASPVP